MKRNRDSSGWLVLRAGSALALAMLFACGSMGGGHSGGGSGPAAQTIDKVPAGAVDPAVERFKVAVGNAPVEGVGAAPITIIEFSDFQCPFCSRVVATFDQIQKTYGDKVRIAFKHNPLPFHQNATPAAQAAVAAQKQGKFWPVYRALFKNQQALGKADLEKYAKEAGCDMAKWNAEFDSAETKKHVQDDMAEAAAMGARGTPFSFINGRPFSGAPALRRLQEDHRRRARRRRQAGEGGREAGAGV